MRLRAVAGLLAFAICIPGFAQDQKDPAKPKGKGKAKAKAPAKPKNPPATFANLSYGPHPRNVLDFWKAESSKPTPLVLMIHGGGWTNGDKSSFAVKKYLDEGISVAAINYRFIQQAMDEHVEPPVKAPLHDAARALQTIRSHAKEWNLDKVRVGATGGSAGACTSLWLAMHPDMAKPDSNDPIARESTRLFCVAVEGPQVSLDPKELREWMPNMSYGGHAFGFKADGRKRPEEFELCLQNRDKVLPWIKEYSPIAHASHDDPPVFMSFGGQKKPAVMGEAQDDPTHSAVMGIALKARLDKVGVESHVSYQEHRDADYKDIPDFLIRKLKQ